MKYGAGERSRTLDLLITSQLLYQLSYTGIFKWWRMTGSNRRPSACKADALPAELILHLSLATSYSRRGKPPTTIGAKELNFRVRYGDGCGLFAIITRGCRFYQLPFLPLKFETDTLHIWLFNIFGRLTPTYVYFTLLRSFCFRQPISVFPQCCKLFILRRIANMVRPLCQQQQCQYRHFEIFHRWT